MDIKCPVVMPYYGGKFTMSKRLVTMLPPHRRYFEVFAGGASMFFRKPKAEWNVLNDVDNDIVNLYICVLNRFEELSKYIFWYPRSRKLYIEFSHLIKDDNIDIPNPERAAQYFFMIRNSFNNVPGGSFSKDTYWETKMVEELKLSKEKLDGTTIENLDFRELIPRYEPRKGDFFYLDPPYVVADTKKYYRNNFDYDMHNELKVLLDMVDDNDGTFMMSYDDVPLIRDLYEERYIMNTIDTKYVGTTPEKRGDIKTELIITNYKIKGQEELFL
jgi:DNA adenine methylase